MEQIVWRPTADQIERARITAFRRFVNERSNLTLSDYHQLHAWSTEDLAGFWEAVWRFCDVRASRPWDQVLLDGDELPGASWFTGARLNFAENLLRHRDDRDAIVFCGEDGRSRRLSHSELHAAVARLAVAMREAGVEAGDRVAALMPNIPETVVAMLATASIGAIWSSCSPDFGAAGVLDRFGQIEPKLLFCADGYRYGGKRHDSLAKIKDVARKLPSVEKVIVVPFTTEKPDLSGLRGAITYTEFQEPAAASGGGLEIEFAQLPFAHPLVIVYSSGTTGLPKSMVHSAGGTLIQHLKEHVLHCDFRREDRVFYFTTCGWMMWNWLVSALAVGATIVLYDGSPMQPAEVLWDLAARERITVFGTSARYLAAVEKAGLRPGQSHELSHLTSILSTGSPLAPESYDFVRSHVRSDVRLSSISGGTDLLSCFALGNPVLPVVRGELQCRGLGMKVEVYDEAGRPLVGEKGELVCSAPFPSMPIGFWNDPDGSRYRRAYFERYENVWHHADYAEITPGGGMIIHGRSDAVLNPGGVRIGTAEITRVVESFAEIAESVVVGQEWQDDVRVVLFVRLQEGAILDREFEDRLRDEIRRRASRRHVPARIIQVADIPRTISGKIVELAVREIIHGRPVMNRDALANPEALELFENLPELES